MSRLLDLIIAWERFLEESPQGSLDTFAHWIISNSDSLGDSKKYISGDQLQENSMHGNDPEFNKYQGKQKSSMQGAYLIGRMNQYVTFYTKPMMKKHGLHSLDDFGYLHNIRYFTNITRTRACELMLQELTTGIDIIKRLIRNGFITEVVSPEDKRQKLLSLTDKGHQILDNMITEFLSLPDTLGELSEIERDSLLNWLNQLDAYHDGVVRSRGRKPSP